MAISVVDGFEISAAVPIDSRSVVDDIAARDAIDSVKRFDGLTVLVLNRGDGNRAVYQLQGGTTNSDWVGISEDTQFIEAVPSNGNLPVNTYGIDHAKRKSSINSDLIFVFSNFRRGSFLTHLIRNNDPDNSHNLTLPDNSLRLNSGGLNTSIGIPANGVAMVSIGFDGSEYLVNVGTA